LHWSRAHQTLSHYLDRSLFRGKIHRLNGVTHTHTHTHTCLLAHISGRRLRQRTRNFRLLQCLSRACSFHGFSLYVFCSQSHKNLCSIFRSFTSCRPTYETAAANQKLNAEVPDRRLPFDKAFFALCGAFCCHRAKKWSVQAHTDTHGHTPKKIEFVQGTHASNSIQTATAFLDQKKLNFNPSHP
jgi:hypothetical protein